MAVAEKEANPLLEGLRLRRTPEPCAFVIFGASGDLTQRKLLPALYSLASRRLLPEKFAVLGVAMTEETDDGFRERMKAAVQEYARDPFRDDVWEGLAKGMRYVGTDFADDEGMERVAGALNELDKEPGTRGNRLYYFAVPPSALPMRVEIRRRSSKLRAADGNEARSRRTPTPTSLSRWLRPSAWLPNR